MKIAQFACVVVISLVSFAPVCYCRRNAVQKKCFYLHDTVDFKKPESGSAMLVAGPHNNVSYWNKFGSVFVFEDPLTSGASPQSKEIGKGQGIYATNSKKDLSFFFSFTALFPEGSLSFHGEDTASYGPVREISVVGGTGRYRFANGYAQVKPIKFAPPFSSILYVEAFFKLS